MFHVKHSVQITGFQLKLAAITAMTCNHVANVFGAHGSAGVSGVAQAAGMLPPEIDFALYSVGGMTFPIMAFLLAEGYAHTSDVRRYALRLGIFALIAQVPYSLLFGVQGNVLFTLLIGLGILCLSDRFGTAWGAAAAIVATLLLCSFADWGSIGFIAIFLFGTLREASRPPARPSIPPSPAGAPLPSSPAPPQAPQLDQTGSIENVSRETFEQQDRIALASDLPAQHSPSAHSANQAAQFRRMESVEDVSRETSSGRRADVFTIVGTMLLLLCVTCLSAFGAGDPFALGYALVGFTVATMLLCLYRGQRGRSMKWFFYAYYPLHLFAIWLIAVILM